jgi:serine/threonine protein kinase
VTHRDLKPSNLIVHFPSQVEVERDGMGDPVLKLADFGSAVDVYSNEYLYGDVGPSQGEETLDYAPPEVNPKPRP